jgi:hypothetical protein
MTQGVRLGVVGYIPGRRPPEVEWTDKRAAHGSICQLESVACSASPHPSPKVAAPNHSCLAIPSPHPPPKARR